MAMVLVFSACSGDEEIVQASSTTSTIAPVTSPSSSSAPPAPIATTSTTSTTPPALPIAGIGETVLVVGDDGVYQVDAEGEVTLLVEGPVAYAVDDTQGGLLFQVDRGRNWDDNRRWSTIIWWIPRGASTPQELLVPTSGTSHQLSLHDTYATEDGYVVLYVRHEGVTPDVDMIDRLRGFDVPAREVTDLYSQGAFEQGFGQVSTNGELIAGVWYQQVGSGCFIYDLEGQQTDLVPIEASDWSSDAYVRGCRLSPSGDRLSFSTEQHEDNELVSTTLHVWDLIADTETTRFIIPGSTAVADVSTTKVLATVVDESSQKTVAFDFSTPEANPIPFPIAGTARFVDTPVEIGAPVRVGAGPQYYRFGRDGLHRVIGGVESQLETRPVIWAVDDLMGGVVFHQPYDVSRGTLWLGAADVEPELLPVTDVWDAALVDGRPMLLVSVRDPEGGLCPDSDFGGPVLLHDLATGDQEFLFCNEEGPDGGRSISRTSLGDDTLVSVEWVMSTDRRIVFMDLSGREATVGVNPVPEACLPCHLGVEISDDGALLAYYLWPTAFWPLLDDDHESAYETWRAAAKTIPVEIAVLDLASGRELWHMTLDPGVRLADFDGRYLVTSPSHAVEFGTTCSVIYDTWGVHKPVEVEGGVALIHQEPRTPARPGFVLRKDGLRAVSFGDPVDDVMTILTEHFGAPTNDQLYESPFAVPAGWDDRGPRACHVATTGNVCFDYIRFVWWDSVGLGVLFSDIEANPEVAPDDDGYWVQVPPSFQGYRYRGHDESAPLYTMHGITVGSTAEDLLSLGPVVSFNWTPCGGQVEFSISDQGASGGGFIYGLLDDQDSEAFKESSVPNENAKILSLNAGQSNSC